MVGATILFFFPHKKPFFLWASSLKKLPIGYFVAFMPFMFSSLSSMEEKKTFGKRIEPHTLG
jgi:hypothetical protein